jgi:hypothetical protein
VPWSHLLASGTTAQAIGAHAMRHDEFRIGDHFTTGAALFRCTDIGSRVVVAVRVDRLEIERAAVDPSTGDVSGRTRVAVDPRRQECSGWLSGPPYAVAEFVFDEYDLDGCHAVEEADVGSWAAEQAPVPAAG